MRKHSRSSSQAVEKKSDKMGGNVVGRGNREEDPRGGACEFGRRQNTSCSGENALERNEKKNPKSRSK